MSEYVKSLGKLRFWEFAPTLEVIPVWYRHCAASSIIYAKIDGQIDCDGESVFYATVRHTHEGGTYNALTTWDSLKDAQDYADMVLKKEGWELGLDE